MMKEAQIVCLLDACSIINLLHIDEEGKLIKRLAKLNVLLCEEVFKEVNKNVFDKVGKFDRIAGKQAELDIKRIKKEIDTKLATIRGWQIRNESLTNDFGNSYFDNVARITSYEKKNGEFFSTAVAFALTRQEDIKLFFHTDDFPAKAEFLPFFQHQQIGYIEDSADLLLLLYRIDEKFGFKELDQLLSKLASEYNMEVAMLEKKLAQYSFPIKQVRLSRELRENHAKLIHKLNRQDFTGLQELFNFFYRHKKKCNSLCDLLDKHRSVLELETSNKKINLIEKIKSLRSRLKSQPIYDLNTLLSA